MNKPIRESIENFDGLIHEIRAMANNGSNASSILRHLALEKNINGKAQLMLLFREAFSTQLKDVSCIGGWWYDGNPELADNDINLLLSPLINRWLRC